MNDDYRGEDVLELLDGFPSKPLIDAVHNLYNVAYNARLETPRKAIEYSTTGLEILEKLSKETLPSVEELADAKGRFNLLLASIYLNEETELEQAAEYYLLSQNAYHLKQWCHLESLAYLGLAITLRKLGRLKKASHQCENAQAESEAESIISSKIGIKDLRDAIDKERSKIHELLEKESPLEDNQTPSSDESKLKELKVFDIEIGKKIVEKMAATTDLNILSFKDYENNAGSYSFKIFDLTRRFPKVKEEKCYFLETKRVNETSGKIDEAGTDDLQKHHLILISEETNQIELGKGKKVAVLVMTRTDEGIQTCATLKTFIAGKDHCLLKGVHSRDPSFVVFSYTSNSKLYRYYKQYKPSEIKYAYEIAISGEVLAVIHRDDL